MDNLHEVDAWLDALLAKLEPAERKKMLREVARDESADSAGEHDGAACARRQRMGTAPRIGQDKAGTD